jgi:phage terminase small subunit
MSALRKSAAVVELSGTARRDRPRGEKAASAPPKEGPAASGECPAPPKWLPKGDAVSKWRELAPLMVERRSFDAGSGTALAMACALHAKIVQQVKAGDIPTAAMVTQVERLLRGCGLVGNGDIAAPATPPENRFARNGRRPA